MAKHRNPRKQSSLARGKKGKKLLKDVFLYSKILTKQTPLFLTFKKEREKGLVFGRERLK